MLQEKVEDGWPEDFFRLLRPHLGVLRHHARRELRMLDMEGLLHRGEVTVDDLQDEVLSRAGQGRAGQEADVIDRTGNQR